MRPVFAFADVHDHYDRMFDLLVQEGLLDPVSHRRLRPEVQVVQLGDLGHFGEAGSAGARLCYAAVRDGWVDIVLLGNHDRAALDGNTFSGYRQADPDVRQLMLALKADGRLQLAHAAHGHLLTHAGLHAAFAQQPHTDHIDKTSPVAVADYLNALWRVELPGPNAAIWDAIGEARGGPEGAAGGILWRHWSEPLYDAFPQVCGHTTNNDIRARPLDGGPDVDNAYDALPDDDQPLHVCLDVGTPRNGRLAGMWLPERRIGEIRRPDWGVTAL